jgi:hypothetical protein
MATRKISFLKQKKWRVIFGTIVFLILLRIALPYIVLYFANDRLSKMDGYYGHIEDIDISLLQGQYTIDSIYINKVDSITTKQYPFFSSHTIDLSVQWSALFDGSIVGEIEAFSPSIRFTKDKVDPNVVKEDDKEFSDLIDDFMPLRVNRFEITDGTIQYVDEATKPIVNIKMLNTYILATNLTNVEDSANLLPSTVIAHSTMYGGKSNFNMKINMLKEHPTFDLNFELKGVQLVQMNNFMQAYANVDVNRGAFSFFTEIAAKDGKFAGYVKPLIKDLDVLGREDKKDSFLHKIYEGIVGTVADIFTNQPKEQFATKVPIRGNFEKTDVDIWFAIGEILRNAFLSALMPAIDREVSIKTVDKPKEEAGFFEGIFGGGDDK